MPTLFILFSIYFIKFLILVSKLDLNFPVFIIIRNTFNNIVLEGSKYYNYVSSFTVTIIYNS